MTKRPTAGDLDVVEQFSNFLSWGVPPATHRDSYPAAPPAWFAYAWNLTPWCPPKGTL